MGQCEFTKADGQRCAAQAMTGSKLCFFHDPTQAAKRKQAQSAGGLASSQGRSRWEWEEPVELLALNTIEDIVQLMGEQLNELRGLEPSPAKGRSIFYGVSLLVRVYELVVFERRLSEIESFLEVEANDWFWSSSPPK